MTNTVDAADDPGYFARDIELIETNSTGAVRYRLQAGELEQNPQSRDIALREVRLQLQTRERAWQLRATTALLPADSSQVLLRESVELQALGPAAMNIRSEQLDYDHQSQQVTSRERVSITMPAGELTALGLDANLESQRLVLGKDVHGRFKP